MDNRDLKALRYDPASRWFGVRRFCRLPCMRKRLTSFIAYAFVLLAGAFISCAASASAPGAFTQLEIESFRWSQIRQEVLFGMTIWSRDFTVAMAADEAARLIADRNRYFQSLNAIGGRILLSGLDGGWHWVAQIESKGALASGVVSAMPIDATVLERALSQRLSYVQPWAPPSSSLVLDHRSRQGDAFATHQVYTTAWSKQAVLSHLQTSLRQAGWEADRAVPFSGGTHWRRKSARLWITAVENVNRSAIFVQIIE